MATDGPTNGEAGDDGEATQVEHAPSEGLSTPPDAVVQAPLADLIKARLRGGEEGGRIGRYLVLRLLGEGGMGSVFAAYDGELDRTVAIKLLRAGPGAGPFDRSWLLGEAKAMARISHPNVVQIYDVGEVEDHVFIAMEMVGGVTLQRWLKGQRRPWRAIAAAFAEAGRGLGAVHAAGLVHRDFKPQNVLVGDDGRVRVLDFGLAHGMVAAAGSSGGSEGASGASGASGGRVIAGTPAYMAPEQLAGGEVDARADIFAFCVALYEAMHGIHPFRGDGVAATVAAIKAGAIKAPPAESRAPKRLRRAIARGLRPAPAERWRSMAELVAVLEDNPWRRRSLALAGAAGILGVAALGWTAQRERALAAEREAMICVGEGREIAAIWGEAQGAALDAAFMATGAPFAADAAAAARRRLDTYAAELAGAFRGACEEHRRGELTDNLYERAQICLDGDLLALRALVAALMAADGKAVEEAMKAVGSLPRIEACRDRAALAMQVRPPDDPAAAAAVAGLREALAEGRAALATGRIAGCAEAIGPRVEEARALGHPPALAEAEVLHGLCLEVAGDYEGAEAATLAALREALASGHEGAAVEAATRAIRVIGLRRGRYAEAALWAEVARGLVRRRGERPEEVARLEGGLAGLDLLQGRAEAALLRFDRALALFEAAYGRGHAESLMNMNNRGAALHALGRREELRRNLEETEARTREALGDHHPSLAMVLSNLGNTVLREGEVARAAALQQEALAIREAALGPEHPELAILLINLGESRAYRGDLEGAEEAIARALAIREAALGPEHPSTADALFALGNLRLVWRGEPRAARPVLERAIALFRRHLPAEHPKLSLCSALLGRAEVLLGKEAAGIAKLEAALRRADEGGWLPADAAEVRFFLAGALWGRPRERARARLLAEEARIGYAKAGPLYAEDAAKVEAWLAARAGG